MKRINYFAGRLLSAEDLRQEQEYCRERLRRHNRALHGWGVVSGLHVDAAPARGGTVTVTVAPGYALAPQGDEIAVCDAVSLPLPATGRRWVVAVRHGERLVDPLPALGEEGDGVEFGSIEEVPVVEILRALPPGRDSPWVLLADLHRTAGGGIRVDHARRRHAKGC